MSNTKPKIMIHLVMPSLIGGPNTTSKIIHDSFLNKKYDFCYLTQDFQSGQFFNIKLFKNLKTQIKLFNPQIVHVAGLQGAGFYAVMAAKSLKKKILVTIHGSSLESTNLTRKQIAVYKFLERYQLKNCDYFYTVSKKAAENERFKIFSDKYVGTIHNPVPFNNTKPFLLTREQLGFSKDDVLLIYTGRITRDKGIEYLIKSFRLLVQKRIKLILLGEGSFLENAKKIFPELNNKKIFFYGKVDNVLEFLNISDIFVFPSLHENLPNSLLEAAFMSLPIVATNVGGIPEVVENGVNGILVNSKDEADLAKAINLLISDSNLRKTMGKQGYKKVTTSFSQENVLSKVDNVYAQMIGD